MLHLNVLHSFIAIIVGVSLLLILKNKNSSTASPEAVFYAHLNLKYFMLNIKNNLKHLTFTIIFDTI